MSYYPTPDEYIGIFIRCLIELFLLGGILYWLYFRTAWRSWIAACPRPGKALVIFVGIWSCVHLLDRFQYNYPAPYSFFPMVRFAMYQIGHPKETQITYEISGRTADGTKVMLDPTVAFYTIGLPSVNTRFQALLKALHSDKPEKQEWAKDQLRRFFLSFKRHPAYPADLNDFEFVEHHYSLDSTDIKVPTTSIVLYSWRVES
jgi:hypothetical protein